MKKNGKYAKIKILIELKMTVLVVVHYVESNKPYMLYKFTDIMLVKRPNTMATIIILFEYIFL
jgi:hypothetical protein